MHFVFDMVDRLKESMHVLCFPTASIHVFALRKYNASRCFYHEINACRVKPKEFPEIDLPIYLNVLAQLKLQHFFHPIFKKYSDVYECHLIVGILPARHLILHCHISTMQSLIYVCFLQDYLTRINIFTHTKMLELYIVLTLCALGYVINKKVGSGKLQHMSIPSFELKENKKNIPTIYESKEFANVQRKEIIKARKMHDASKEPQKTNVIPRIKSLSGDYVDPDSFTHNNMTPFFGRTIKQNMEGDKNASFLENYTGKMDIPTTKCETTSFYDVKNNVNNVNGSTLNSDALFDRYVPSQIRNNERPIDPIRVGPGVNKGYTSEPSGGFQQYEMQDLLKPKTVDELRPANKPKETYEGRVLDGVTASLGAKKESLGTFNKNRADTFYEQGEDRWLRTMAAYSKPTSIPTFDLKDTSRPETHQEYIGAAIRAEGKQGILGGAQYTAPLKEQFKQFGIMNPTMIYEKAGTKDDYGKGTIFVYDNERQVTGVRVHQGNLTSLVKSIVSPVFDALKITKKDGMADNPRHYGNAAPQIPNKTTVYDPNNTAKTTIKETLIHDESSTGAVKGENKSVVYDPNDVTRTTIKQTTLHDESSNGAVKGGNKSVVYDPNDVTRTTIKQTTLHDESSNGAVRGGNKSTVYDPNDVTRTTIKQTTLHDESSNGAVKGGNKSVVYDPNDVTRTTIRQTTLHDESSHGAVKGGSKSVVYDPNDVTRTTIRQTTMHDESYNGAVKGGNKSTVYDPNDVTRTTIKQTTLHDESSNGAIKGGNKSTVYDPNDVTRTTIKQTTLHDESFNGAVKGGSKSTVYDPNDVTRTTIKETTIHDDRNGNLTGNQKATTYDPDDAARTTIKETTIHDQGTGTIKGPQRITIYDPNNVARTTIKETMIHDTNAGVITGPRQIAVYDPDEIARTTGRETLETARNEMNLQGIKRGVVYDPNDKARPTMKETLVDNERDGNLERLEGGGAYETTDYSAKNISKQYLALFDHYGNATKVLGTGYLTNPKDAKNTQKQYTSDIEYFGGAESYNKKDMAQDNYGNARIKTSQEMLLHQRVPTASGAKKYTTAEDINVRIKKSFVPPEVDSSNKERVINQPLAADEAITVTRGKKEVEHANTRLDPSILSSLRENPFALAFSKD
jgi:hypothetical protein